MWSVCTCAASAEACSTVGLTSCALALGEYIVAHSEKGYELEKPGLVQCRMCATQLAEESVTYPSNSKLAVG